LNPFGSAPSVGAQSAGSIPFGSGSFAPHCSNPGPGDGNSFGGTGIHCFNNINDDKEGNSYSHLMSGDPYNGKYFVGVRFPSTQYVLGIRVSRDATNIYRDRSGGNIKVYITRPALVQYPSFTTSPSLWECVGIIPPRSNGGYFWYEFPTVYDASGIILEMPLSEAIDELKVYTQVNMLLHIVIWDGALWFLSVISILFSPCFCTRHAAYMGFMCIYAGKHLSSREH
jgi:hypothetical protein